MFYSHEILTSRKYGVATVWLVATLGANRDTGLRKIGRKEILSVNVPKACDTVIHPDAPLALRLQSTLLVGISRVYRQQFDYLYHDVSHAHANIRRFESKISTGPKSAAIDLGPGREINPEQLVLPNDPAFSLEMLPEYDFRGLEDLFSHDLNDHEVNLVDEFVFGTPRSKKLGRTKGSTAYQSLSSGSFDANFEFNSVENPMGPALDRNQLRTLENDPGFEFNEYGELRELTPPLADLPQTEMPMSSRRESGPGFPGSVQRVMRLDSEDILNRVFEDHKVDLRLPEAAQNDADAEYLRRDVGVFGTPKPPPEPAKRKEANLPTESKVISKKRRRAPRSQQIVADDAIKFSQNAVREWREDYLKNMAVADKYVLERRASRNAKLMGRVFFMEHGPAWKAKHSILKSVYSGQASLSLIKGEQKKAPNSELLGAAQSIGRGQEKNSERDLEVALGLEKNMVMTDLNDIETGRDDPQDSMIGPLNGDFPWNKPSSMASSIAGGGVSIGGVPSSSVAGDFLELGSRKRPRFSESPLAGRRIAIDRLSNAGSVLGQVEELDEGDDFTNRPLIDDFEFFGEGAVIQTQDANTQWLKDALDDQSYKMLEFLKTKIIQFRLEAVYREKNIDLVTFEDAISPQENRRIVAAQGFHHILLLASKGLVYVSQEKAYGTIQISATEIVG